MFGSKGVKPVISPRGAKLIMRGARNQKLRNILQNLWRPGAKVGDGSTMDILVKEAAEGCVRGGCRHFQKAVDSRTGLIRLLREEANLSSAERKIISEQLTRLTESIRKAGG